MIVRRVLRRLLAAVQRVRGRLRNVARRTPHSVRARFAARRRLRTWRAHLAALREHHPGRPVVAIGLIEHLGDIVAAEPVARHVRAEHPNALVVWPVRAPYRELVRSVPEVDAVLDIGCITEWSHIAYATGFDRVIDLHIEGRSCPICQQLHERVDGDRSVNIGNYYRHGSLLQIFSRAAGLPVLTDAPRLHVPASARERVNAMELPERFVAVHCTSNQDARDWRPDRWNALASRLVDECGVPVVEIGLTPVLAERTGVRRLCGDLSVMESAEVIRRARLFIGIDSGPAHLANAVGTPGVILLGRYRSYDWYLPYTGAYATGERADIIHHDAPAAEIPVARVLELARAWLEGRREREHRRDTGIPPSLRHAYSRNGNGVHGVHPGRVSVVIPTFAHRDYVLYTVQSVLRQGHEDLEVIVVNDGSPDDTADRVRPLAEAGRIVYVEQPNQGQGAARNRGLERATGEFVSFLDDDDVWPEGALALLLRALHGKSAAVMAYGDHMRFESDGEPYAVPPEDWPSGDVRAAFRRRNWLLSPGQALMRTADVRAIGGFDPRIWGSDDWDLYIRLAQRGEFVHVDAPTLHYRVHASNASRRAVLHARNHLKVVRRHIGWDVPEVIEHQRLAARYFVPNLMQCAATARRDGRAGEAVSAHLYALLFDPALATRPWFVRSLAASALGRPPRA